MRKKRANPKPKAVYPDLVEPVKRIKELTKNADEIVEKEGDGEVKDSNEIFEQLLNKAVNKKEKE